MDRLSPDMAHRHRRGRSTRDEAFFARVGGLILGCTAILTLSFFGLVAFITASTPGVAERIPFYVLGMAIVFVAGIIVMEQHARRREAQRVLWAASVISLLGFILVTLAGEGLLYAARNPETALASERVLYLIAAGLIGTGIGYWGVRNWKDVAVWIDL